MAPEQPYIIVSTDIEDNIDNEERIQAPEDEIPRDNSDAYVFIVLFTILLMHIITEYYKCPNGKCNF